MTTGRLGIVRAEPEAVLPALHVVRSRNRLAHPVPLLVGGGAGEGDLPEAGLDDQRPGRIQPQAAGAADPHPDAGGSAPGPTSKSFSTLRPCALSRISTPGQTSPRDRTPYVSTPLFQRAGSFPRKKLACAGARSSPAGRAVPPTGVSVKVQPPRALFGERAARSRNRPARRGRGERIDDLAFSRDERRAREGRRVVGDGRIALPVVADEWHGDGPDPVIGANRCGV